MARETWVQSQLESYERLKKWYLMLPCLTLSIIRSGSRVKWSNPGKGVAHSSTPWCSWYRKWSLWVPLDYGRQLYLQMSSQCQGHERDKLNWAVRGWIHLIISYCYSPLCLEVRTHSFWPTWPSLILKVLAIRKTFLEPYGNCATIQFAFTFHKTNVFWLLIHWHMRRYPRCNVVGNGHGDTSSNLRRGSLYFT